MKTYLQNTLGEVRTKEMIRMLHILLILPEAYDPRILMTKKSEKEAALYEETRKKIAFIAAQED